MHMFINVFVCNLRLLILLQLRKAKIVYNFGLSERNRVNCYALCMLNCYLVDSRCPKVEVHFKLLIYQSEFSIQFTVRYQKFGGARAEL